MLAVATTLVALRAEIDAYNTVFLVAAAVVMVGAVLALWINVPNERTDTHVMVE